MTDRTTEPTFFARLSRTERRRLRTAAPGLAEAGARTSMFRAAGDAGTERPAALVTHPLAIAAITRVLRRLLRDQTDDIHMIRLTMDEALSFPGQRHPREYCGGYHAMMAASILAGERPPSCVPILCADTEWNVALRWAYFVGDVPPDDAILHSAREGALRALSGLAATSFEAFVAPGYRAAKARQ